MAPGMGHCGGGEGPNTFDMVSRARAVGRARQGARSDHRVTLDRRRRRPDAAALSVSAGRGVQRQRKFGRGREFCLSRSVTPSSRHGLLPGVEWLTINRSFMKSTERHRLKENEFARSVAQAREFIETRRRDTAAIALVIVAAILLAGGYGWWRHARDAKANTTLAAAPRRGRGAGRGADPARARQSHAHPAAGDVSDRTGEARSGAAEVPRGVRQIPEHRRRDHGALPRRRGPGLAGPLPGSGAAVSGSDRQGGEPHLRPHGALGPGGSADRAGQGTTARSRFSRS